MSKAIMQQTYNFEALHDKELAEHFLNAGKHLSGEVEVLGSAIRCIMLTGDNLSNKEIILQLIHAPRNYRGARSLRCHSKHA